LRTQSFKKAVKQRQQLRKLLVHQPEKRVQTLSIAVGKSRLEPIRMGRVEEAEQPADRVDPC
jgi:hypothetical protein